MKRLFIIVCVVLCAVGARAQGFPSTDSLRNYNTRFTTNSAITWFTNLRGQTLLRGIIDHIDSVDRSGVDTFYKAGDTLYLITNKPQTFKAYIAPGGGGGGSISDGDKGDIVVSSSGATWTIDASAVTTSKINDGAVTIPKFAATKTYPAQSTFGRIFYDSAFTDLTDFIPSGGPSIALSSAKIAVTNTTISDLAQVAVKKYKITGLHKWTFRTRARATNRVIGFGMGIMSAYSGDNSGLHTYVATSGSTGFFMRSASTGTSITSGSGPSVATNDILEFTMSRNDTVVTATVQNITSGSAVFTLTKTFSTTAGTTLLPNDGYLHWVSFNDNFEIISQEFSSTEYKNPVGMIVGDSKSEGYYSTNFAGRYWKQLNDVYPNIVLQAGQGNTVAGALRKIEELYAVNPEWVLLADIGRNDLAQSVPLATVQQQYAELTTKLSRGGQTKVYHIIMPEDSVAGGGAIGLTAFKNWIQSTYGTDYIAGVWDSLSTSNVLKSIYKPSDNIHLNQAANDKIAAVLIASGKLTTQSTQRYSHYSANDGFLSYTGDVLHTAFDAKRVPHYLWKSDTLNNLVPSLLYDNGSRMIVSTNKASAQDLTGALFNVDGASYVSGVNGFFGIRDRTTADVFGNIAQSGVWQVIANGTGGIYMDNARLTAFGTNPATTGRGRGTVNIWLDRTIGSAQLTKGLGLNVDSMNINASSVNTYNNINTVSIMPAQLTSTSATSVYNNPASFYIGGAPYAGSNSTVSTPWSIYVNAGNSRLAGLALNGTISARATDTKVLLKGTSDSLVTQADLSTQYTYPQFSTIGSDASSFTASVSTFYTLADLTGTANATITLPSAASHAGRQIILWNNSSDATFKWSYAAAITLPDGTTRTTFADGTLDVLLSNGSVWIKTN